ncbi:MAG: long-chain fatty acid--CoA ligase [Saprospiraceae bacterium]|nr:long-chain fatty acid--CoA ligase [Saprospiraceae bacterium]
MEPTRLFDFIYYQKENHPQAKAYNARDEHGNWVSYSTDDAIKIGNQVSRGLLKLGVKPGDKIATAIYKNRPEWVFLDIGIAQIGAINVPVYPTISPDDYEYIFNDAEVKFAVVGGGDLYDKVRAAQPSVPSLVDVFTFDQDPEKPYWKDFFAEDGQEEVDRLKAQVEPEELATLIYTSGTTGKPKGVMLSHRNIVSNTLCAVGDIPYTTGDRVLSFLPLCHIFERTATYLQTYAGINVFYTGTDNLGGPDGDIQAVKPHFFNTVPRLLEKVYEKIYSTGDGLTGMKRRIFFWALALTDDFDYDKKYGGLAGMQRNLADKLVFSKWREALGGNVKGILSGAAPLPPKIARVFSAAGIPIREGYGLTETSPGLCFGRFREGGAKIGCIGPILPGIKVIIDDSEGEYREGEGEILANGPNVMMGYYNKPDKTAEVFKEMDGVRWFKTGDIGKFVKGPSGEEFLKITDRKKELLKTSGGKYVAPAPIENRFKEEFLIEQMMVVGEQKKFVSALIVPAAEALQNWCRRENIAWTSLEEVVTNPKVVEHYQSIVHQINPSFSHIEQIKKFTLVPKEWLPVHPDGAEAELTPTMKLKRRVIRKKYANEINSLYAD